MFSKVINKADIQVQTKTDIEIVELFYKELKDEPNTLKAFKREIRRFMFWLHAQDESLRLSEINFLVVQAYRDMLSDIPDEAISSRVVKYHSNKHANGINPEWRPFKQKSLSPRSIRAAMNLLSSFGNWAVSKGFIPANPFANIRKPKGDKQAAKERLENEVDASKHFNTNELNLILFVINQKIEDAAAASNDKAVYLWRRFKFIFTFLRRTGLRREEMVTIEWKNIKIEERDDGAEMHLIRGIGKGSKDFTIPLSYDAYEALQDYQADLLELNKDSVGKVIDGTIMKRKSGKGSISTKTLHCDFKEAFYSIAEYLAEHWESIAPTLPFKLNMAIFLNRLKSASLHYMRHSAITENAKYFKDVKQLQEFARHSSINVTAGIYWHTEKSDLHKAINRESGQD